MYLSMCLDNHQHSHLQLQGTHTGEACCTALLSTRTNQKQQQHHQLKQTLTPFLWLLTMKYVSTRSLLKRHIANTCESLSMGLDSDSLGMGQTSLSQVHTEFLSCQPLSWECLTDLEGNNTCWKPKAPKMTRHY